MKTSLYTKKEYLICTALNLLSLIFWFLPSIRLADVQNFTFGELGENLDVGALKFLGIVYIIVCILGIIAAAIPAIEKMGLAQGLPAIKDGLFVELQCAPMVHLLLLICWIVYINAEAPSYITVGLGFGGVMTLLIGIAGTVWYLMLNSRYKKNKKARKAGTSSNV